jgi:hypothetical protein
MSSNVESITHLVQLAMTPAFMLTGIGAVLSVLSARLSRTVDRSRQIKDFICKGASVEAYRHEAMSLDRRSRIIHKAIYCCSLAAFSICTVVFSIFLSEIFPVLSFDGKLIAWCFSLAMMFLSAALVLFLREIRICYVSSDTIVSE